MHNVTHGSFHRDVIVLQSFFISDRKCLPQDCGRSCMKTCTLYYYLLLKGFIWMYACLITYVLSISQQNVHIVDLYVVPIWKDKNVYPVHSLPVSFFFFLLSCTYQPRKSSIRNRHKSIYVIFMHAFCHNTIRKTWGPRISYYFQLGACRRMKLITICSVLSFF